ncbi:MAG: HAMP domain-containing histidine kinase [Eggerthellaceae bacterium]|nr:HAMP domain-containing histidine kinase [Eggerthellaceae bacterium]
MPEELKDTATASSPDGAVDDFDIEDDVESDEEEHGKRRVWSNLSYAARVTISFSLIAAMTALVAIGVVSFVWEQHFTEYTQENMHVVAETTANRIAEVYEQEGSFTKKTLQPAENTVAVTHGVGVQVVDAENNTMFDSSTNAGGIDGIVTPSIAPQQGQSNMAHAPIIVDDQAVGSVRVWVYGSDQLLRSTDQEFRDKSYQAMILAAIVAIVLASVFGYFFARNLVRPIRRMTETAVAIKEGDLTARTDLQGEDEISQLGQTFDAMADAMERDRKLERRLTTDVAHELRTPLMAIQATVEAMVDGVLPVDEQRLMTVDSEVMRLSRLVDQLLKLSRLENRANPNKQEIVNVGEVVAGIIATHEAYVREAGLTLKYRADPNVLILGDPDLIRQATANLISNAVRYTDEGGHITVRVKRGETMASISVQDTGIGLTPEEARMVFQRFWRADSGRDRESGGLGVGLTVVKEIVERHNGWVQVEGRKGEGSCFTIHIPLYVEKEQRKRGHKAATGRLPKLNR